MNLRTIKRHHNAKGPHSPWVSLKVLASEARGMRRRTEERIMAGRALAGDVASLAQVEFGSIESFRFVVSPLC